MDTLTEIQEIVAQQPEMPQWEKALSDWCLAAAATGDPRLNMISIVVSSAVIAYHDQDERMLMALATFADGFTGD